MTKVNEHGSTPQGMTPKLSDIDAARPKAAAGASRSRRTGFGLTTEGENTQ
jgi:hypothetical protein